MIIAKFCMWCGAVVRVKSKHKRCKKILTVMRMHMKALPTKNKLKVFQQMEQGFYDKLQRRLK